MLFALMISSLCLSHISFGDEVPRPEHPNPQMYREEWINLNGVWEFTETDDDNATFLEENSVFPDKIVVPFCRESSLSGLGRKDFVRNVWYRRKFSIPQEWKEGKRILLHIGACDWKTRVWVNGNLCGEHTGGSAPITCDITSYLKDENIVIIHAFDDVRTGLQAGGKQSPKLESFGCVYTRTTGIWQTVWLEAVGTTYISNFKIYPEPENGKVRFLITIAGEITPGLLLEADSYINGEKVSSVSQVIDNVVLSMEMPLNKVMLWHPGSPNLYDLTLQIKKDGRTIDKLSSYFGLRTVKIQGRKFLINGKPVFQRLVLYQGFHHDGIWTARSDDELKADLERSMDVGFNGARLHQKVFEPRLLYWADKLGFLLWGEFPDWQLNHNLPAIHLPVIQEWVEVLNRDFNHPSIIGWCPFNETPKEAIPLQNVIFEITRAVDPTRPLLDTSGWTHGYPKPLLLDAHDYEQNPVKFKEKWDKIAVELPRSVCPYAEIKPLPFFISEYGGIGWNTANGGWGYGENPKTLDEFYERLEGLTKAIADNPNMFGYCYTQLHDIEQEQNGIYTYERSLKFDKEKLRAIFGMPAKYEQE